MEDTEPANVITLVEEDAHAELAPLSGSVDGRRARFLGPRAGEDPSAAPATRLPLLRDLVSLRLLRQWPPKVLFWGWLAPGHGWLHWVQRLRPAFRKQWRSAGIRDAITISTCTVPVDVSLFLGLLECWSPETNTFILPWPCPAEATLSLEDVMLLGGFSVLGEPVRVPPGGGPGEVELLAWLTAEHRALERSNSSSWVSHGDWTSRFMGIAGGKPSDLEHAAFVALWLSRYVFPAPPHGSVGLHVLPLAVRLSRGTRVALGPAVLATIYRDLRLLRELAVHGGGGAKGFEAWAPFLLLQLWGWERFESLRPPGRPSPLSEGKARAMRWDKSAPQWRSLESVRTVLESPGEFRWRPYAAMVADWSYPSYYCYGDRWVTVGSDDEDDEMRCYARCLRACELVGLDSVEHYSPQRVAMQFGLDQDLPGSVPPVHGAWGHAWATYDGGDERVRFYVPPRFCEPSATRRFLDWQKQCALDRSRSDELRSMAKKRKKKENEKRRRLRKKAENNRKGAGLMPNGENALKIRTQEVHCSGDFRSMKTIKRTEAGEDCALKVVDNELDKVKEDYVLKTNEQQSPCAPSLVTREQEIGMSPSSITFIEIESDDEELQRTKAREASAVDVLDPEVNRGKEDHVPNIDEPESSCGLDMLKESEGEVFPCEITFIEIESDNEEVQRQKDLEFDREINQLKAEIASLQALITRLESGAQMEPARIPHLS